MATRTPAQVYAELVAAGLPPDKAVTLTAIAGAESGDNDTALGDVRLEDSTWGPSYGLFQVRTLKGQTGSGSDRDINWLAASDADQAKAAYDISAGGQDFSPWTTFRTGAYQTYLPQAQAAAGTAATATTASPASFGPDWLPWNWGADITSGVRAIVLEGVFVVLGLGLVYAGAVTIAKPKVDAKTDQLRRTVAGAL